MLTEKKNMQYCTLDELPNKNVFTGVELEKAPVCPIPPATLPPCPPSPGDCSELVTGPSVGWLEGENWEEWLLFLC